MFTVSIHLPSYTLKESQITHLAEEFYGKQLGEATGGDSDTMDYGFEDLPESNGEKNGKIFRRTLDDGFLKRKP